MNSTEPIPAPSPTPETALNRAGKPYKRKAGGGRPPKKAGRARIHFSASLDSLAVREIQRLASLEGQTVNDYLSDVFEPCEDAQPVASDLT